MTVFIFLGSLLAVMALGVPIAYSLLLSGVALMWHLDLFDSQILAQNVINGADSFPLLAVPFFMLAGEIMNVGGLSRRIVNLALTLVGHLRGGLGFVAIVAACLLAALSGSAVADTAALAALLLPMMARAGHDKARAAGLIASAGIIAPVIPPSIGFVIFGVAANVSISKLFLAGIVPGLLMGISIGLAWWWVAKKENIKPPPKATTAERLTALKEATWALVLPVIVLVGLKHGGLHPHRSGRGGRWSMPCCSSTVVIYRELSMQAALCTKSSSPRPRPPPSSCSWWQRPWSAAWLITVADLPRARWSRLLEPLIMQQPDAVDVRHHGPGALLVGTAMDMTPTILILTPVLMPVVKAAGIDPVYFGVLFIINNSIGLITPPVGTVLNTVAGVGQA